MDKQTILITGATGNVGGGAAIALARRGARVVLLGRSLESLGYKANSIRVALSKERREQQETDIDVLAVDFSDMNSARHAATEALNRYSKIHGLVLSAVTLVQNGPNILPSGHEVMFATNQCDGSVFVHAIAAREHAAIQRFSSTCNCAIQSKYCLG